MIECMYERAELPPCKGRLTFLCQAEKSRSNILQTLPRVALFFADKGAKSVHIIKHC